MLTTLLFDIGGVVLTNAWDHQERARAWEHFHLDKAAAAEINSRHAAAAEDLECGRMRLNQYLDQVIFFEPRPFTRAEVWAFMQSCSKPLSGSLELLRDLAHARHAHLASLNNEGLELNEYRIQHFELRRFFVAFCSSCYLDARKPHPEIFRRALGILHARPEEAGFIDDRAENLDTARKLGLHCFPFLSAPSLRHDLDAAGLL